MITMAYYPAGQHTVGGIKFEVYVDDRGWFRADAEGFTETHAETRQKLEANLKVKVSQAKVRVEIPFVKMTNMGGVRGKATGIDARTGGVTIKWDDGSKGTTSKFERAMPGTYLGDLSDGDLAELRRLIRARDQAAADLREFAAPYSIDLPDTVRKAVDEARAAKEAK